MLLDPTMGGPSQQLAQSVYSRAYVALLQIGEDLARVDLKLLFRLGASVAFYRLLRPAEAWLMCQSPG